MLNVFLLAKSIVCLQMRSGYGRCIFEPLLPLILGRDISGEVAATGTSTSSFSIGQEVYGALHPTAMRGTCADYAILSEDELTPKPSTLTHVVRVLGIVSFAFYYFLKSIISGVFSVYPPRLLNIIL